MSKRLSLGIIVAQLRSGGNSNRWVLVGHVLVLGGTLSKGTVGLKPLSFFEICFWFRWWVALVYQFLFSVKRKRPEKYMRSLSLSLFFCLYVSLLCTKLWVGTAVLVFSVGSGDLTLGLLVCLASILTWTALFPALCLMMDCLKPFLVIVNL